MIPYGRQDINQADIDAVVDVLNSNWLTQGPAVPLFEEKIASYSSAQYGVAVSNATAALHLACLALGVGPGDRVWTSPNSFVASANCALYCGAAIDFVDIDPKTYNLSTQHLIEKLEVAKVNGKLPKVVIPVHFAGQSCDMAAIHQLSKQYGFKIIEDASHAIGAKYMGRLIGGCFHSDITIFSFHPVKIITTGEGGIALTNDQNLAESMRQFRSHGIINQKSKMDHRPNDEIWNYQQVVLGYNYRMTDMQAALGLSQMDRLSQFLLSRRKLAARYDDLLSQVPVQIPWQHPDSESSYHLYPIRISGENSGKTQHEVYNFLHAAQIGVNLHYIPVYRQPYYESMGFYSGYCPESERYFKETITLPLHPGLTIEMQDYIIDSLKKALLN